MSFEPLIAQYGLLAVFIGAAIEGETVVFLGGVLSHRHLLPYWAVALAASMGSFCADQIFFFAGRYARQYPTVQAVLRKPAFVRVHELLERYPTGFIFAFRFLYGLRTISPIAIGTSKVTTAKFVTLNALAALIWGPFISGLGYVFGQSIEQAMGFLPLHQHVLVSLAAVVLVLVAVVAIRKYKLA
ncbi:DedA family protein [Rhizobium tubonense]|uniref:DedA family protein n=1 Tax=Rhizobium tubonense TaxID=484088 RepID=A0A2W4F1V9_9HYPH|nr:DedA family protein [Rhizobium tubonense]PZM16213.1 DedA family protein [Rhizobium tubonense]